MASNAIHGINGLIYLATSNSGAAAPLLEQAEFSIEMDLDLASVLSLGNSWDESVAGALKWNGSASGNFDPTSAALFTASTARAKVRMYVYPDVASATRYYYGMVFVKLDKALAGGVSAPATSGFSFTGSGALSMN